MLYSVTPRTWSISAVVASLLLSSCGGSGDDEGGSVVLPPSLGFLTARTPGLAPGAIWELDRPIVIEFSRAIDPSTLTLASVFAQEAGPGGAFVPGSLALATDPATGAPDPARAVFQPDCPTDPSGAGGGLAPGGIDYTFTVQGADVLGAVPIRAIDGAPLDVTLEVTFRTPTPPMQLFFDRGVGPPAIVARGDVGVLDVAENTTRLEVGLFPTRTASLRRAPSGGLALDPVSAALFPDGLPLNHWIAFEHRVALVLELDDVVDPSADNLARVGLRFRDGNGAWQPLAVRVEVAANCAQRGSSLSTLRVTPLGPLPAGRTLGVFIDAGFADRVGDATIVAQTVDLGVQGTTTSTEPRGARVDALFEPFVIGGDAPGSMEDTTSDLGAPRAHWGVLGGLIPVAGTSGLSRARSKWFSLGEAGFVAGQPATPPTFSWTGTDAQGRILRAGGRVAIGPAALGPMGAMALGPATVTLDPSFLADPTGAFAALPAILTGDRAVFAPVPASGSVVDPALRLVQLESGALVLGVDAGCSIPGILTDCVPRNLTLVYPGPSLPTVAVAPQSFQLYSGFLRDVYHPDHRVTITWDAARADAEGAPDAATAVSAATGWTGDPTTLSGGDWDFVRFEVQFELDVSGNGPAPGEGDPILDFIKLPFDVR